MRARKLLPVVEPLAAGVFGALLVTWLVAGARIRGYPVGSSDFHDYCLGVEAFRAGQWSDWPSQRAVLAGALPGFLAGQVGLIQGLVYATAISTVGWVAATWTWAWAIAGRRAAWFAVLWIGAFAPLVVLSRTVSFYPEVALVQVSAAAAVAGAVARGAWGWSVATAVLLYLLPLADVRSVIYVVALAPVAMVAALFVRAPAWGRALLFAAQPAALSLAWTFGGWSYPGTQFAALQPSVYRYVVDASRLLGVPWAPPDWTSSPPFAWARTPVENLLPAIRYLGEIDASRPDAFLRTVLTSPEGHESSSWAIPAAIALGLALVGLARRPRALLALLATAPVFFVVLRSATLTLPHPRQLAMGAAALPVLFGIATAMLLLGVDAARARLATRRSVLRAPRWREGVAIGLGALLVAALLGLLPTPLHPGAAWRQEIALDGEPAGSLRWARANNPDHPRHACAGILRGDAARGHSLALPFFDEPPSAPGAPAH